METIRPTEEQIQARQKRNRALVAVLVGFMVLLFVVSVAQLQANMAPGLR
jgi:hypothetical protein